MAVYLFVWFFFTITTYGVYVPAGLFLPGIIIGCAVGAIYEDIVREIQGIENEKEYSYAIVPLLLAVGAMLSSYCRLSYSLVVVMLETTSAVNIFAPMIIAVMVGRFVANLFTPSLYARAITTKGTCAEALTEGLEIECDECTDDTELKRSELYTTTL